MTTTRERAINLRDWEVRAIRAGRLKLLVRPMKPQPNNPEVFGVSPIWGSCVPTEDTPGVRSGSIPAECVGRYTIHAATNENGRRLDRWIACPYGQPGDRLRGREAWQVSGLGWGSRLPIGKIHYRATDDDEWKSYWGRWKPAITMPRWAVRNWLEITEVRCGRAQEMSEDEAVAAGFVSTVTMNEDHDDYYGSYASEQFARQYDADHGEGAWERDWVWMIGIKRIEGGK